MQADQPKATPVITLSRLLPTSERVKMRGNFVIPELSRLTSIPFLRMQALHRASAVQPLGQEQDRVKRSRPQPGVRHAKIGPKNRLLQLLNDRQWVAPVPAPSRYDVAPATCLNLG
jgi:hypothetical protein